MIHSNGQEIKVSGGHWRPPTYPVMPLQLRLIKARPKVTRKANQNYNKIVTTMAPPKVQEQLNNNKKSENATKDDHAHWAGKWSSSLL